MSRQEKEWTYKNPRSLIWPLEYIDGNSLWKVKQRVQREIKGTLPLGEILGRQTDAHTAPLMVAGDDEYRKERLCSAPWEDRGKRAHPVYQEPETVQDSEILIWP